MTTKIILNDYINMWYIFFPSIYTDFKDVRACQFFAYRSGNYIFPRQRSIFRDIFLKFHFSRNKFQNSLTIPTDLQENYFSMNSPRSVATLLFFIPLSLFLYYRAPRPLYHWHSSTKPLSLVQFTTDSCLIYHCPLFNITLSLV